MRPEDLTLVNWRAEEYLRNIRPSLMDAKPVAQVFEELNQWLPEDGRFYCWDDSTRSIFQRICREYGSIEREVKTLRDGILSRLGDKQRKKGNPIRLCTARELCSPGSCYDAEKVLSAVIKLVKKTGADPKILAHAGQREKEAAQEETRTDTAAFPLVYSRTSHRKTVHRTGCGRLRRVDEDRKRYFQDMRSARLAGFHPCSCCSPVRKLYRGSETALLNYCRLHGLSIHYFDDAVHVTSRLDLWRIIYDDESGQLVLLHKNTMTAGQQDKKTQIPGFHIQKCDATTLKGILRNIARHDEYREQEGKKEAEQKRKPKEAKKAKKKEKKRKIRRTLALIDELRSSGRL